MPKLVREKIQKHRFLRFIMVGVSSFLIDFTLNNIVLFLLRIETPTLIFGINIKPEAEESIIANLISVPVAFTYNFLLSRNFTFKSKSTKRRKQLVRFFIVQVTNFILSTLIIALMVNTLTKLEITQSAQLIQAISKFTVTCIFMFINFALYNIWVFKEEK